MTGLARRVADHVGDERAQRVAHRVELAGRLDPRHLRAGAAVVPVGPELELFGVSAAGVGVIELFEIHGRHSGASRVRSGHGATSIPSPRPRSGPITLRNRIIKAATFEGRTPKRVVTPELIEFHRRFAAGGVGMTTVAYCAVTRAGSTDGHQIVLDNPEVGAGLRELTDAVHAEGAAIAAQIGHAGPVANPMGTKSPSARAVARVQPARHAPHAGGDRRSEIATIIEQYAHGAGVLRDAGFDAIEVHIGHGYLLSAFLSPQA